MKKCNILLAALLMTSVALTSCGQIKIYETEHHCEDKSISDFDEVFYEKGLSAKKVSKDFDDFCLYNYSDDDKDKKYAAVAEGDWNGETCEITLFFNADQEFNNTCILLNGGEDEGHKWYDMMIDEYGEPASSEINEKYGLTIDATWDVDNGEIRYMYFLNGASVFLKP